MRDFFDILPIILTTNELEHTSFKNEKKTLKQKYPQIMSRRKEILQKKCIEERRGKTTHSTNNPVNNPIHNNYKYSESYLNPINKNPFYHLPLVEPRH
jgi:hypothetical protein